MIGPFSARRCFLRQHREGIRQALALADRIDALGIVFAAVPAAPPARRALARLEEELAGLVARHGGRLAVAIRRRRGFALPGLASGVEMLRLPAAFAGGGLPAGWWKPEVWLEFGRRRRPNLRAEVDVELALAGCALVQAELAALAGSQTGDPETRPETRLDGSGALETPFPPAGGGKFSDPPGIGPISRGESAPLPGARVRRR